MKLYIKLSIILLWTGMLFPDSTRGQSPGSEEVLQGFFSVASGGTSASASESLYIGPGTYEINGAWEIYSKNVWISPEAVISGSGSIKFFNPVDAGGTASSTLIDGNNSAFADVNIELQNTLGMHITDRTTASLPTEIQAWTNIEGDATLKIGKDFSLAVDGADVWLGDITQGDFVFDADATLSNYRPERMVITNNSIVSHLVKQNVGAATAFVFPIGIADGDYTPAQVTGEGKFYSSVQDFTASASNEGLLSGGPDRTWIIYADQPTTATIALQHNTATDAAPFSSAATHAITQFNGTAWSVSAGKNGVPGVFTTGTSPVTGASTQDLANVAIPTAGSSIRSYFTKAAAAAATPDLTITLDIDALSFPAAGTSRDFVINLYEINGANATNPIVFRINKLSAFAITYPASSGNSNVFGGTPNENSNWTITENSSFITVTAKTGVVIPTMGQAVVGFNITRKTGISPGTTQNIAATITGGSAGEANFANNATITSVSATAN